MKKVRTAVILVLAVLATASVANAATIKELQGAWALDGSNCDDIFTKAGKKIAFKDRIAPTSTGLLFSGNKVAGPMAVCTITKVRKKSSRWSAHLACETSIIVEELTVGFDLPHPTHLRRFDLFGGTPYATYQKCEM